MKIKFFLAIYSIATLSIFAQYENNNPLNKSTSWSSSRPDGHAPISVMADHTHHKGEFMFSYRFMTMDMRQLRQGTKDATVIDVHANYMIVPKNMTMNMHMLGAMYAPSDKLTLMVMANYLNNKMTLLMHNHDSHSFDDFSTNSDGLGDITLSGLYSLFNKNRKSLHAEVGVIIPTGSIKAKDTTPMSMGNEIQLPYPMQLGKGAFGSILGLTYLGQCHTFSWGHQLRTQINYLDNNQDYKFGNRYSLNNWIAAQAGENLSVSVRFEALLIGKIDGKSPLLNPMMVSTADTNNSGGSFINSGFGLNYLIKNGSLKGLRFASEISTPLYQDLNGIQLKQNYNLTVGIQYAIH